MPIPLNQVTVAEISMKGIITGGGSTDTRTNFIFHYRRLATAVDPTKAALNTAFVAGPVAAIAAALNEDWAATLHDIRWVNDALDQYTSIAATEVGAITGDRLASDQAAFLLFRTGLRGRSYRGSKHLGPFSESDVTHDDCDLFNAACVTRLAAINTALAATLTDSTGNQWKFTLLSRKLSQLVTNPTTVITNDITSLLVNKRVGSMLRRKVRSVY